MTDKRRQNPNQVPSPKAQPMKARAARIPDNQSRSTKTQRVLLCILAAIPCLVLGRIVFWGGGDPNLGASMLIAGITALLAIPAITHNRRKWAYPAAAAFAALGCQFYLVDMPNHPSVTALFLGLAAYWFYTLARPPARPKRATPRRSTWSRQPKPLSALSSRVRNRTRPNESIRPIRPVRPIRPIRSQRLTD